MSRCTSCKSDVIPGNRWCGLCRTNIVNPGIGRLAPPGKRLGAFIVDIVIPVVAFLLILSVIGAGAVSGSDAGFGLGGVLGFGLYAAYVVWALVLFANGMTPGKQLLGMKVIREDCGSSSIATSRVGTTS